MYLAKRSARRNSPLTKGQARALRGILKAHGRGCGTRKRRRNPRVGSSSHRPSGYERRAAADRKRIAKIAARIAKAQAKNARVLARLSKRR